MSCLKMNNIYVEQDYAYIPKAQECMLLFINTCVSAVAGHSDGESEGRSVQVCVHRL